MKFLFFDQALVRGEWQQNVRVAVHGGAILSLDVGVDCDGAEHFSGAAIPAMANVHSHAFQRGFAGLAEYKPKEQSDFWAWREVMYQFAQAMTPEHLNAIAAQLYLECLTAGYSHVGEFHYLHNADQGLEREMVDALLAAAETVGIGVTLCPVLYQFAGLDESSLEKEQEAFALSYDDMLMLHEFIANKSTGINRAGFAFHSLRAVSIAQIKKMALALPDDCPLHIHIAEQEQELYDCVLMRDRRPVQYLYEEVAVDKRWCLVHATHVDPAEIQSIAESGAVVGLCPTTEANLGDGLFPLLEYIGAGGRIAIGSDSHVCRNPFEELRLLEYGQRLNERKRTLAYSDEARHVGDYLWQSAAKGGYQALGIAAGEIAVGQRADIVVIDRDHPALVAKPTRSIIDSMIFGGGDTAIGHMIIAGEVQAHGDRHPKAAEIYQKFSKTMRELMA